MRIPALCALLVLAACGGDKSSSSGSSSSSADAPPPAAPKTGAPVAFVVDKVTPGKPGNLAVRAYNLGDKLVAQYSVVIRYYDAAGKTVTVKPGTAFEESFDMWSFAGRTYACQPKTWCSFTIDHLDVPGAAAKAEVLAVRLAGNNFDDTVFDIPPKWPGADKEPVAWPAAFAPFGDAAKGQAAWQGAWAGDGAGLGDAAAWQVTGTQITFVNKQGEKKLELSVDSPCTAGFGSGNSSWQSVYTVKDGQLITGLGDAGLRKGDKAIVCGAGDVWLLDGATCTRWANHFRRWESSPGKCGIKQDAGKDVFFYVSSGDYESKLAIEGDVIWSDQLAHAHAQKFPDLAAAKAAQKL